MAAEVAIKAAGGWPVDWRAYGVHLSDEERIGLVAIFSVRQCGRNNLKTVIILPLTASAPERESEESADRECSSYRKRSQ